MLPIVGDAIKSHRNFNIQQVSKLSDLLPRSRRRRIELGKNVLHFFNLVVNCRGTEFLPMVKGLTLFLLIMNSPLNSIFAFFLFRHNFYTFWIGVWCFVLFCCVIVTFPLPFFLTLQCDWWWHCKHFCPLIPLSSDHTRNITNFNNNMDHGFIYTNHSSCDIKIKTCRAKETYNCSSSMYRFWYVNIFTIILCRI